MSPMPLLSPNPKAKAVGTIMNPASSAAVSNPHIVRDDLSRSTSFLVYDSYVKSTPIPMAME